MAKNGDSGMDRYNFSVMRDLCKRAGMTIVDLSERAGISPAVISKLERNQTTVELKTLFRLERAFGLTASEMLVLVESRTAQACVNWMVEQKKSDDSFGGCIINVGSISATIVFPNRGDYCISKAGLGMMSLLFAARLGEFSVPVYEISSGIIKTDMTAGVTSKYDNLIDNTELLVEKRWGLPEDIGKRSAAMARGDMPYTPGQAIYVDGGLTMNRL